VSHPAKPAPAFALLDQHGIARRLEDYRGRWVVVYFYPKDESLNCTRQACNFRDEYRIIAQFGNAEIIGINKGSVESHRHFAEKHHLNFPILSDPDYAVTNAYGAWKFNFRGARLLNSTFSTRRNTYLVNPEGLIVKTYRSVNPNNHAADVIRDLQRLQAKSLKSEPV
jgi:peroxiredoxin Q/BCP